MIEVDDEIVEHCCGYTAAPRVTHTASHPARMMDIDALAAENAALRARVDRLKARLAREREKARRRVLRDMARNADRRYPDNGDVAHSIDRAGAARRAPRDWNTLQVWNNNMRAAREHREALHAAGQGVP